MVASRCARDHQGHLASHPVTHAFDELGKRRANHLLVHLRELARERRPSVAQDREHVFERRRQPVRRLEEHDRALLFREVPQSAAARGRRTREEALEREARRGHARQDERREDRRRSRHHLDVQTCLKARGNQSPARIGNAGHPRVGHERDVLAGGDAPDELRRPRLLVVRVVRDEASA